jgi:hypothetical protein
VDGNPITSVYGGGPTVLQVLLWAALVGALAGFRSVVRAAGLARREWLALGAIVAAAGIMRLLGAPATILHDNSHAYTDLELSRRLIVEGTQFYGNGFFTFWSHLFRAAGENAPAVWVLHGNAVLDTLTTGFVGLLAATLSRRPAAATLAAAFYAVLPVAVKIAHTESFFVLGAFLGCLGFLLAAAALRERSWVAAVAGGLVLGYASHVRPELAVLPALTLLLLVSATPTLRELVRRPFAAVLLTVQVAAAWPALAHAWRSYSAGEGAASMLHYAPGALLAALAGSHGAGETGSIFTRVAFTPPVLPLLFAFGLAAAVRLRARWAIFPALAPLALLCVVLPIQNAPWVAMRLQHAALYLFCLLPAAALVVRPWGWLTPSRGMFAGVLACLATLPYAGWIGDKRAPQQEFDFLQAAVERVPRGCTVLLPGHDREIVADLPTWLSDERGLALTWMMLGAQGEHPPDPVDVCVVWYRGTNCYAEPAAGYGAPSGGMRPACADFERTHVLEPLATAEITGASDTFYRFSRERLRIGFFFVD